MPEGYLWRLARCALPPHLRAWPQDCRALCASGQSAEKPLTTSPLVGSQPSPKALLSRGYYPVGCPVPRLQPHAHSTPPGVRTLSPPGKIGAENRAQTLGSASGEKPHSVRQSEALEREKG